MNHTLRLAMPLAALQFLCGAWLHAQETPTTAPAVLPAVLPSVPSVPPTPTTSATLPAEAKPLASVGLPFWQLTTVDGKTSSVSAVVPLDDNVLRLTRSVAAAWSTDLYLVLRDGRRLPGVPTPKSSAETLGWRHSVLGEMTFPLSAIAGFERGASSARGGGADRRGGSLSVASIVTPPGQDVAFLQNRDRVVGLVTAVSSENITLQPSSGDAVVVAWSAIEALAMTDVAAANSAEGAGNAATASSAVRGYYRIELADGTVLTSPELTLSEREMELKLGTEQVHVELTNVALIERIGFRAFPLSLLTPVAKVHQPYLTVARPPLADVAVDGSPLVTKRGLTLTAYTRLEYAVPPTAKSLRLRYALDPSASDGSATVRILTRKAVLHDGKASPNPTDDLNLSLDGSSAITIEIGFGPTAGTLARVNILEPLFVK